MVYTLFFFSLQNAVCFIIITYLVPVLFTFYIQGVLKLKKNNSGAKMFKIVCTNCLVLSCHYYYYYYYYYKSLAPVKTGTKIPLTHGTTHGPVSKLTTLFQPILRHKHKFISHLFCASPPVTPAARVPELNTAKLSSMKTVR